MSRLRVFKPQKKGAPKKWRDTLNVESLADDGRGVARRQGKVVFVDGALPGESVVVEQVSTNKRFDEATLVELHVSSEERVVPACEHYETCGGCQLQHLSGAGQMRWKTQRFDALMSRVKGSGLQPPLTDANLGYRHRLRLFIDKGELGLRQRGSHRLVAVPHCRVARPVLARALKRLYEQPLWLSYAHAGEIELVEGGDGQVAASLRLAKKPTHTVLEKLRHALPVELLTVSFQDKTLLPANEAPPELTYPGGELRFCAGDFTQVNPAINAGLIAQVVQWLQPQPGDQILDAFSGLGNFSISLARSGARVIGLELDAVMVSRAAEQARFKGLENLSYSQRDLFAADMLSGVTANKALLDPPRSGAKALCESLSASTIARVVYVSCDPATLERDLAILVGGGFAIKAARWADMFPQTNHMESLVLLTR